MLAIQSRMNVEVNGPPLGHAKTLARISVDFLDALDLSLFRLRFAYMQFDWEYSKIERAKLLVGHYYQPTSLEEAYPDTLGYSQGALFDPFTYAPQVTYRYTHDPFTIFGSLNADWQVTAARNAVVPDLFLAGHYKFRENYIGAGVDYHRETPRLVTDTNYQTSNSINSWLYYVYAAFKKEGLQAKFRFTYVENGIRYCMLGGRAVRADDYNPVTDQRTYTNLRALAWWTELIWRYKKRGVWCIYGLHKKYWLSA